MATYISSGITYVSNGQTLDTPYVYKSGSVVVLSGGSVSAAFLSNGGVEIVSSGGIDRYADIVSGGVMTVSLGGLTSLTSVYSSGSLVAVGGRVSGCILFESGAKMYVNGVDHGTSVTKGYASDVTIQNGADAFIGVHGVGSAVKVVSGYLTVNNRGYIEGTQIGIDSGTSRGAIVNVQQGASAHLTYVHSNGMLVVSADKVTATRVSSGGSVIVSSGGLISGTSANGGVVDLLPKGSAQDTVVQGYGSRGAMYISSGASATRTTIQGSASMVILKGGFTFGSNHLNGGTLYINSGGYAFTFDVDSGGKVNVSAGGIASDFVLSNGRMSLLADSAAGSGHAYAEWISITSSGSVFVSSGASITSSFVEGGYLMISSGGDAKSIEVGYESTGGLLRVYEGAYASGVNVSSGASADVSDGNLKNVFVRTGGHLNVNGSGYVSGGSAYGSVYVADAASATALEVLLLGSMTVRGKATNCTIYSGGYVTVSSGGNLSGAYASTGGIFKVSSGGSASVSGTGISATLDGGAMNVFSGQVRVVDVKDGAFYLQTSSYLSSGYVSGGSLVIASGGSANNVDVSCGVGGKVSVAQLTVYSGGKTSNGHIHGAHGSMLVLSGGNANSMTIDSGANASVRGTIDTCFVSSGGSIYVSSGGAVASRTTIGIDGEMQVFGGGKAEIAVIGTGGELMVYYNASANLVNVNGGLLTMSSGGTATSAYIREGGSAVVNSQGRITSANIESGGVMDVLSSGYVYSAFVSSGAMLKNSGGLLGDVRVLNGGTVVCNAGTVWGQVSAGGDLVFSGGWTDTMSVSSGGRVRVADYLDFSYSGGIVLFGGTMDFDISNQASPSESVLLDGFDQIDDIDAKGVFTLTVSDTQKEGTYKLASYADTFNKSITVKSIEGADLGTLSIGSKTTIGEYDYSLAMGGSEDVLSVTIEAAVPVPVGTAKSDIDGNGISDVMFVWTGEHGDGNYQHGYWMNGTSEWQSVGIAHPAEWDNLGCYDMTGDGKADSVLVGNVTTETSGKGAYIGYYADANDLPDGSTWVNIGYLNNADDIDWKNAVGNLTGNASGVNSIVWYAPELYALGVWTDGTENWVTIAGGFDANWALIGCGDFSGDGKDQIVMSLDSGANYYAIGIDNTWTDLGASDSGWKVRAIGDFSGDGLDDIVAFHKETGIVAMWGDGNSANWSQLGQLDASDWFVVGAGDYNGDQKDGLLVRQYSTGMLGYYSGGDMENGWVELGRGVDMNWTVVSGTADDAPAPVRSDIDGNGVSDVMFVWSGNNYQHGYWMNGTNEWQSTGSDHPAEWENLGCYDMTGDGKADSVLIGNVVVEGVKGAYVGYYADGDDNPDGSTWVNIGFLNNADNIDWKNKVGNLTGNASGANSIVWYTHELGTLGAWTDGTENWVTIAGGFDASWALIGCGDFSGDGKDQIVMSLNSGANYYAIGIDNTWTDLGASDSGWEVRAIGDFSGDGRDDIVAFHKETGLVAMWGDGVSSNWSNLGQLDASDWFVVGAGDYNGDQKDDLLVRQYSTGMLGYYSSGDTTQWVELGRGVDMNWTVIA